MSSLPCGHPPPGSLDEMKTILSFYNSAFLLPGLRSVLDRKTWIRFSRDFSSGSQAPCNSPLCTQGIVPCVVSPLFPGCTSCVRHNVSCSLRGSVLEQTVARYSSATASQMSQFRRAFQAHMTLASTMPEAPFENLLGLFTQIGKIQEMIEKGTSLSNIPDEFFTHIRRSIFAVAIGYQDRFLKIVSQDMMIHDVAAIVKDAASSSRISPTDAITRLHLLFHQRETYSHIWNDPTTRYGAAPHEPIPSTVNISTM